MIKYSVKKPYTVFVGIMLVIILGVVSFLDLKTDLLPTIELPFVIVQTVYPGATPERVETGVTTPIEQVVSTVNGLNSISSISAENMSMVILEFSDSVNMDSVMLDLSANLDMVSGYFDDMVQPPILLRINPDSLPIQMITVNYDDMDIKELTKYVEEELVPYLKRVEGVASIDVSGTVTDRVEIRLNQLKIDNINANILKTIDSDLYETQQDLESAQSEIDNGLNELDIAQQEAFDGLAQAGAQIDSGVAQLQGLISEKASLESLQGVKTGQRGVLLAKQQLLQLQALLNGLTLDPVFSLLTLQDIYNAMNISPPDPVAAPDQYALFMAIFGITSTDPVLAAMTPGEAVVKLQGDLDALNAQLPSLGIVNDLIVSSDPNEIGAEVSSLDAEIESLKQDIAASAVVIAELESAVAELEAAYVEMETQKLSATSDLTVTETELRAAQTEIDKGLDEFETAKEEALKSANIDQLVTREAISGILMAQNFSMPAGYVSGQDGDITVKVGEQFSDLDSVKNLLLLDMGLEGLDPIYLKDVADVVITDNSEDSYVRVNGNYAITLSIQKSSIASTSEVSDLVNTAIADAMALDDKLHIDMLMDQGIYIDLVIDSVMSNLIYGGIIALILLLIFLKDLRPTIIIGLSIPLSLMLSIVLMYFSDITLNIISLSGLALGVGMLVDNSIVALENIYRLRKEGYSRAKAAVVGASQVAGAIFASTLTTVCVFLPIVFTDGISRQLFEDMGLVIAYSLFSSLLVAMTVVPAMSSTILRSEAQKEHKLFDGFVNVYEKVLRFNLRHKYIVILLSLALFVGTMLSLINMPLELFPSMSSTQMQMTLTMEEDIEREVLIANAEKIATDVQGIEGVQTVSVSVNSGSETGMMSFGGGANTAMFNIVIDEDSGLSGPDVTPQIRELTTEFEEYLTITESNMDMSALSGEGITVTVKGNDLDVLQQTATDIKNSLLSIEGIEEISDGSEQQEDELRIIVDPSKAAEHSLTIAQVFQQISDSLSEETASTTLTFAESDMAAVILPSETLNTDTLSDVVVATEVVDEEERDVLLTEIATIVDAKSPSSISRDGQSRSQNVTITISEGYNVSLIGREVDEAIANFSIPDGYSVEISGENETIIQTMSDLVLMLALAIMFIYLIMVAQFQSLLSPFIVIFTIPLAFTGGLLALLLNGEALSVTSMVGFLVLSGVVVNNGIVFVDYVNQLREEGMEKRDALIQAGRDRIRPIFMTALTTILAMSTMAMGVGLGAEMSQGMAVVTIGGLSYATVLTLLLIPALYEIFNRRKIKKLDLDDV